MTPQPAESAIAAAEIRHQLERILNSSGFRGSPRLQRFLQLAVTRAIAGEPDRLKEYALGRDVFDRGEDYDPRADSIVRVEARRLRRKLQEYYDGDGGQDPVRITFVPGSYVPAFARPSVLQPSLVHPDGKTTVLATADPRTVAVLPFSNLSPEAEQDYFCDGVTEDVINALAAIPDLQVIGRTSMFALRRKTPDPHEIGSRFGAGTIVEGSVRKASEILRISVKIIDTATRQVRWSQVFDRATRDVFAIEDEIARSIADTLRVTLGAGTAPVHTPAASSTEAHILYLKGRQAWNQMSAAGYRAGVDYFSRAIAICPDYAPPYAGLADAYSWLALWSAMRPNEAVPKGKQAALEALRLDPQLPQAHASLGALTFFFERQWYAGLELERRALSLSPSYATGYQVLGAALLILGRFEEAIQSTERGVHLDPLSFRMNRTLGMALQYAGRTAEAEKWFKTATALEPASVESHYMFAKLYLQERRDAEALQEARKCGQDSPAALSILGAALARNGDSSGAERILEQLAEMSRTQYVDPLSPAIVHVALGNTGAALDELGKSLEERSPLALFFNVDPIFDEIRGEARFRELVSAMRFPA